MSYISAPTGPQTSTQWSISGRPAVWSFHTTTRTRTSVARPRLMPSASWSVRSTGKSLRRAWWATTATRVDQLSRGVAGPATARLRPAPHAGSRADSACGGMSENQPAHSLHEPAGDHLLPSAGVSGRHGDEPGQAPGVRSVAYTRCQMLASATLHWYLRRCSRIRNGRSKTRCRVKFGSRCPPSAASVPRSSVASHFSRGVYCSSHV